MASCESFYRARAALCSLISLARQSFELISRALERVEANSTSQLTPSTVSAVSLLISQALDALLGPPALPPTAFDPFKPTLPLEIISLILNQLTGEGEEPTLAFACLASRQMLPLAREVLYRTLRLVIRDQEGNDRVKPSLAFDLAHSRSTYAINYKKLALMVGAHPHLARLVDQMELQSTAGRPTADLPAALEPVACILDACNVRDVKVVDLGPEELDHFVRLLRLSGRQFREVEMGTVYGDPRRRREELWEWFEEQKAIEFLSIEIYEPDDLVTPKSFASSLRRLSVTAYGRIRRFLDVFTLRSASTLTHLEMNLDPDATKAPFRLAPFVQLVHLTVRFDVMWHNGNFPLEGDEAALWRSFLSAAPTSLLSLTINDFLDSTWEEDFKLATSLQLASLPPTLQTLRVDTIDYPPSAILAFLRSKRCPILRRLKYSSEHACRGSTEDWDEEREDEVEALLEELGIESF